MLASLEGLDHVVVMAGDLDRAADGWRRLGFTLSPRGTHSDHVGTANYTIMLGPDYVELLGIVRDTPLNAPGRAFLQRRGEGIERVAFTTSDAAQGVAALRDKGVTAIGPVEFSRPVELPGGGDGEAAFSVFHWPFDERPGDLRIFACQHHTRDTVWIPELQRHANTATRIRRVEIIAPEPGAAARHLARLIDGEAVADGDGSFDVPTAAGRGLLRFVSQAAFRARYGAVASGPLPEHGAAALVLGVADLSAAARAVGTAGGAAGAASVTVAAARANGVMLVFEPD